MIAGEPFLTVDPWADVANLDDPSAHAAAWLRRAVGGLGGAAAVREAVLVLGPANVGPFAPQALWPLGQPCSAELSAACERVLAMRLPVAQRLPGGGVVQALPVVVGQALIGVVALRYHHPQPPANAQDWLRWGTGWLAIRHVAAEQEDRGALHERLMVGLDLLALVLGGASLDMAASVVVTEAAQRLGCDRVSLGLVQPGGAVRLLALSHTADFARRQELARALEAAMTEAADQGCAITLAEDQPADAVANTVTREHRVLAREFGSWRILTVPFSVAVADDEHEHGVFMFEWAIERDAHPHEEALAETLPAILGHALVLKRRQARSWWQTLADSQRREYRRLLGPRHTARKLVATTLVGCLAFAVFAKGDFRVSGDAHLEGRVRRLIVSPFDGYVASAEARAGQVVKAGQLLATLDDRELQLEASRWSSQQSQYTRQANDAEAQRNLAQTQIAQAQSDQASAQRELSEHMMAKAQVTAPFDGLIVSGDLSQQLGAAVRKGQQLFEIAPMDAWRVVLEVPEGDIAHIKVGQRGRLVLTAMPDRPLLFEVKLVTAVAHADQGKNFFRVEAMPLQSVPELRPGMVGLAKVSVSDARLVWIWTRNLTDWLRLQAWSWLGI